MESTFGQTKKLKKGSFKNREEINTLTINEPPINPVS